MDNSDPSWIDQALGGKFRVPGGTIGPMGPSNMFCSDLMFSVLFYSVVFYSDMLWLCFDSEFRYTC